jgi:hypothetical protein
MKELLAGVIALFCFLEVGSALAGSCRPIEDAELKKMSTEKLVENRCAYLRLGLDYHKTATHVALERMRQAARQGQLTPLSVDKELTDLNASGDECSEQANKIYTTLKNRSDFVDQPCGDQ